MPVNESPMHLPSVDISTFHCASVWLVKQAIRPPLEIKKWLWFVISSIWVINHYSRFLDEVGLSILFCKTLDEHWRLFEVNF